MPRKYSERLVRAVLAAAAVRGEGVRFDEHVRRILAALQRIAPYDCSGTYLVRGGRPEVVTREAVPDEFLRTYAERWRPIDPMGPALGDHARPIVTLAREAARVGVDLARSEYLNEGLRGIGVRWVLGANVPVGDDLVVSFALARAPGSRDFDEHETRAIELVIPYLARNLAETAARERTSESIAQTIERLAREALTPRESEVVVLLSSGLRQAEIGRRLGIATTSVRDHLVRIRAKLGARTNEQVVPTLLARGAPLRS